MVAAAALLSYIKRARTSAISSLVGLVEMSVEILDAMDESVVARKCAEILKRHLREVDDSINSSNALMPFSHVEATTSSGEALLPPVATEFEVGVLLYFPLVSLLARVWPIRIYVLIIVFPVRADF